MAFGEPSVGGVKVGEFLSMMEASRTTTRKRTGFNRACIAIPSGDGWVGTLIKDGGHPASLPTRIWPIIKQFADFTGDQDYTTAIETFRDEYIGNAVCGYLAFPDNPSPFALGTSEGVPAYASEEVSSPSEIEWLYVFDGKPQVMNIYVKSVNLMAGVAYKERPEIISAPHLPDHYSIWSYGSAEVYHALVEQIDLTGQEPDWMRFLNRQAADFTTSKGQIVDADTLLPDINGAWIPEKHSTIACPWQPDVLTVSAIDQPQLAVQGSPDVTLEALQKQVQQILTPVEKIEKLTDDLADIRKRLIMREDNGCISKARHGVGRALGNLGSIFKI